METFMPGKLECWSVAAKWPRKAPRHKKCTRSYLNSVYTLVMCGSHRHAKSDNKFFEVDKKAMDHPYNTIMSHIT